MSASIKPLFLDLPAVSDFVALSESSIQKLIAKEGFPRPRQLSGRRVGWLVSELEAWADERPIADNLPPVNSAYGRAGNPANVASN